MIVYILIIILLVLLSLKYDLRRSTKAKDQWGYFVLVILVLLAGFRGDIGHDTMVYHRWYDYLSTNPLVAIKSTRFEPLFVMFCSVAKGLGCSWLIIQLFLASWINYSIFSFVRKYSSLLFLPLLLYFISVFYYLNCEEIRGAVAFGFVLIALPYLEKKKYLNYIIWIIIGCGFHYSNALFLALPFIPQIFKNKLILVASLGICIIAVNILQARFGIYAMIIDRFLGVETVSSYADGDYIEASGKTFVNLVNIFLIGVFFPLVSYLISRNTSYSLEKLFTVYIFCIIGSMVLPLFYRFNHQLAIVNAVVLCGAIDRASQSHKFVLKIIVAMSLIISIYSSITNYLTYNSSIEGYFYENFIPYTIYDI